MINKLSVRFKLLLSWTSPSIPVFNVTGVIKRQIHNVMMAMYACLTLILQQGCYFIALRFLCLIILLHSIHIWITLLTCKIVWQNGEQGQKLTILMNRSCVYCEFSCLHKYMRDVVTYLLGCLLKYRTTNSTFWNWIANRFTLRMPSFVQIRWVVWDEIEIVFTK